MMQIAACVHMPILRRRDMLTHMTRLPLAAAFAQPNSGMPPAVAGDVKRFFLRHIRFYTRAKHLQSFRFAHKYRSGSNLI